MSVEGWRRTAIQDLAADIKGSFIDGDWIEAPYITDQGIRLIQTGNIGVGDFIDKNKKYISEDAFVELKCKEVYIGDILICRLADPIGRSCIVPNLENKAITSVDVCILRIDEKKYDKHFIAHSLNKQSFLDICQQTAGGSTRQRISRTNLGKIEIDIPKHKKEQEKIAAVLSTIDRAIAQTEAIIAKQQRIKTGLMQDLLTKGIDEHGNIRSEATHEFKDSAIGRIPVEWEVENFIDACERVSVGIATSTTKYFQSEGVPLLRNQNILSGVFDLNELLYISLDFDAINKSKRLKTGDLVTMRTGYPGRTSVTTSFMDGWQTFTTLISTPKKSKYRPDFLSVLMNSCVCRKQILTLQCGGAQQNLNVGWLIKMKVFKPSIAEQTGILSVLNNIEKVIDSSSKQLQKLHHQKTGLMQDLLTGKVRVTELLKEREPASP